MKSGVKGQTYFDDHGDVRTDTGEKVEDVEKNAPAASNFNKNEPQKIVDLQKPNKAKA